MGQSIELLTVDRIRIVGTWVTAPTTVGVAILLHALPSNKESWSLFQRALAQRGIASLAVDLRGHGESKTGSDGRPMDYRSFGEEEQIASLNDVEAAYDWIRARGIDRETIVLVGASIGANLALRFLSEHPTIPAAALLSPGMDYHGVEIGDVIENIGSLQSVWMSASSEDDDASVVACNTLMEELQIETKVFKRLSRSGHGTALFDGDAALMGEIADWLRDRIQTFDLSM